MLSALLLSFALQASAPARPEPTASELAQLEATHRDLLAEYERVSSDWIEATKAARAAKRASPLDPTPAFVPRFRELLARGLDHAAVWVLHNDLDVTHEEILELFERLVRRYHGAAWAAEIVELAPDVAFTASPRMIKACEEFVELRHADALAARLVFLVASNLSEVIVVSGPETPYEQALAFFRRYVELWPEGADVEAARRGILVMENLRVGKPAPEIVGKDVDGRELRLSALRGKVVVIDFWATWCAPCVRELPHLAELRRRHAGELEVLGIANDDDAEDLRRVVRELEVTWPNVFENSLGGPISRDWGVAGLPTTFVIDRQGVIRARNSRELDALVAHLVAGEPAEKR